MAVGGSGGGAATQVNGRCSGGGVLGGGTIDCRLDEMAEANDVAKTDDSEQLKLVYEQQAVNVSKRGGKEV